MRVCSLCRRTASVAAASAPHNVSWSARERAFRDEYDHAMAAQQAAAQFEPHEAALHTPPLIADCAMDELPPMDAPAVGMHDIAAEFAAVSKMFDAGVRELVRAYFVVAHV